MNNSTLKKLKSVFSGAGPIPAVVVLSVVLAFSSETFLTLSNWMNIP